MFYKKTKGPEAMLWDLFGIFFKEVSFLSGIISDYIHR